MAIDKERKEFFYKFNDKKYFDKNVDYSRVVHDNKEGMTPLGKEKIIEFFLEHPDSYRKIFSFIKLKQSIADKYVPITLKEINAFTKIKKDDILRVMFYLSKKLHLLKGNWDEYRIPEYLWNTDILNIAKKKQQKNFTRKTIKFAKKIKVLNT